MDQEVEVLTNDLCLVISLEVNALLWDDLVTKEHGYSLKRSFRLKGIDLDNQSSYARGLMIHSSYWVDKWCWKKYIPLHRASCQGCVTVSSRGMNYLWPFINKEKKPLLLWSFVSKQS